MISNMILSYTILIVIISLTNSLYFNNKITNKSVKLNNNVIDVDINTNYNIKSEILQLIKPNDNISFFSNKKYNIINKLVCKLEQSIEINSSILTFPSLWSLLDGDWKLLYSNVLRNEVPSDTIIGIDQVIQNIDSINRKSSHILKFNSPLILLNEIKLIHDIKITSTSQPAQVSIALEDVAVNGKLGPQLNLPFIFKFFDRNFRSSVYDITYIDENLRISRGDRGELRIFKRA